MRLGFFLKEAFRALRRSAAPSLAAALTVLLTAVVLGVFIPIVEATTGTANEVRSRVVVDVYVKDSAQPGELAELRTILADTPNVADVEFISKQQALEQESEHNPEAYQLLGSNPLPDSFRITPEDPGGVAELVASLEPSEPAPVADGGEAQGGGPAGEQEAGQTQGQAGGQAQAGGGNAGSGGGGGSGPAGGGPDGSGGDTVEAGSTSTATAGPLAMIDEVQNREDETEKILSATSLVKVIAAILAALLVFASVALVANTIRLSIFARRREIEVMRLVGATKWFVRWPFVIEGMIVGVLGGAGAIGVLYLAKITIVDPLSDQFALIAAPETIDFRLLGALLLTACIVVAAIGSGVTLRRFLRV